jgi:hypothetical protein
VLRKAIAANKVACGAEVRSAFFIESKTLTSYADRKSDMSKKTVFLDRFMGYVQAVDISLPELQWL